MSATQPQARINSGFDLPTCLSEMERSIAKLKALRVHPNDEFLRAAHIQNINEHLEAIRKMSNRNRRTRGKQEMRETSGEVQPS